MTTLSHMLAHTYEAEGLIPQAIQQWQYCVTMHQYDLAHHTNEKYPEQSGLHSAQKGLYEDQMRVKWRARDTKVPVDFQFHPQLVRVAPRVFVLKGTMNAIGATEVHAGDRRGAVGAGGRLPRRDSPERPGLHVAGHPVVLPVVAEPEPEHDDHAGRGLGEQGPDRRRGWAARLT